MAEYPKFSVAFNIGETDAERIAAFELYQAAFHAVKVYESRPPQGGDIHITMQINGFYVLLGPGSRTNNGQIVSCEMLYDDETELRRAYGVLAKEGTNCSIGSYPWAPVGALVTDKFGVTWWLRT